MLGNNCKTITLVFIVPYRSGETRLCATALCGSHIVQPHFPAPVCRLRSSHQPRSLVGVSANSSPVTHAVGCRLSHWLHLGQITQQLLGSAGFSWVTRTVGRIAQFTKYFKGGRTNSWIIPFEVKNIFNYINAYKIIQLYI